MCAVAIQTGFVTTGKHQMWGFGSGGELLLYQWWCTSVTPVVVILRYTSGGEPPLYQWWWSYVIPMVVNFVIPVVVIFRYISGADLPLYQWWWSSVTPVIFRYTSGDLPLYQWRWTSVIPVEVIFRYPGGGDLPLYLWCWSSVISVVLTFCYYSGGDLPFCQWWWTSVISDFNFCYTNDGYLTLQERWWTSVITVMWTSVTPVAVNFPYTSGGEFQLHVFYAYSGCSQIRRSLALVMLRKILKTEENLRALEWYNRRTWADYTNGWSTLCYVTHS